MSQLTPFTYHGPASGVSLETAEGLKEYLFFNGKAYDLPADNEYVKDLVAQDYLKPAPAKPKADKAPAKKTTKNPEDTQS